jgi:hypothetical protein
VDGGWWMVDSDYPIAPVGKRVNTLLPSTNTLEPDG